MKKALLAGVLLVVCAANVQVLPAESARGVIAGTALTPSNLSTAFFATAALAALLLLLRRKPEN